MIDEKIVKKINTVYIVIILVSMLGCNPENSFSIQNCYGDKVKVIIDVGEEFNLDPMMRQRDNQITLELDYPEVKRIGKSTMKEIREGLPFQRMMIIKSLDTVIIKKGEEILPMMDTDLLGQIGTPYVICI